MCDSILQKHVERIKNKEIHVHYLGKRIQNEIINILSKEIKKKIVSKIMNAKYFSIIVDCTTDISRQEQMSLIVRYVFINEKNEQNKEIIQIEERFLEFIKVNDTTGSGMAEVILKLLEEKNLNIQNICGQGYDNGSNMKGKNAGVQAHIINKNPRAFFVPCCTHSLNLVLSDAASCNVDTVLFFDIIQSIYNFFSSSSHRWQVLLNHVQNFTLKPLCTTRWESRVEAVKAIRNQLKEIHEALIFIAEDNSLIGQQGIKTKLEASSLAKKINSFKFIFGTFIWYDILSEVNASSKQLQNISCNIIEALKSLDVTKNFLTSYRSETNFLEVKHQAHSFALNNGFNADFSTSDSTRTRRVKTHFDYECPDEPITNFKRKFQINFFNVILDSAITSLNERFEQLNKYESIFGFLFNIGNLKFEEDDTINKACLNLESALSDGDKKKDISAIDLFDELKILSRRISNNSPKEVLKYICANNCTSLYPNVYTALRILLTIPTTVASAERSFSKLKLIKNYLRSTMSQERLDGLAMLSIESDIAEELDLEEVVKTFAEIKARKVSFS